MPDYALYKLTVSVVTPLHIGNGRELLSGYDFAVHDRQTWRINDAALLDAQNVDDPAVADRLAQTPPAQLLVDEDYLPGARFFRYVIKGEPRSQAEGATLREQIKNIADQPYLPGSSLKGALRTALAWFGWGQTDMQPGADQLIQNPKYAAQNLERQLFMQPGARPWQASNYDLLRALQISDSQPLSPECLMLVNASVLNRGGVLGSEIPVEVEAIRPDTVFEMTLKIDAALFSDWAQANGLHFPNSDWLAVLPSVVQAHTRQRLQGEIAWYQSMPAARRLLTFYQERLRDTLGPNQFLLQLGWGAGWDGKTFGSRLRANRPMMQFVLSHTRRAPRQSSDPYPRSRRVAVSVAQDSGGNLSTTPAIPLGWVLLSLEPLHEPAGWQDTLRQAAAGLKAEVIAPPPAPSRAPAPVRTPSPVEKAPPMPGRGQAVQPQTTTPPAATRAPAPSGVQAPTRAPAPKPRPTPPPPPAPQPITAEFTALPKIGNRFLGKVYFSDDDATVYLSIPGLSADDLAMAFLAPKDNPGLRVYDEDEIVTCEVLSLQEEPHNRGHWLVRCRNVKENF